MEALFARLTYAIKQIETDPNAKAELASKAGAAAALAAAKDPAKDPSKTGARPIPPGAAHKIPDPTARKP
jgi:hypothetical protein